MKPRLYIHIGFPKTGTSTIQKFCFENRDHLKEKGIYYPAPLGTPVFSGHTGHLDISEKTAALFQGRVPWKKCLNRYLSDMLQAKCKINILSSEGLASDNPKNLELFRKEFDVRIVCFFRNIFDFLSSHEKQVVKDGLRCDFFANLRHRNTCFLYAVDQYVKFFGIENCIFLNYDRITKEGNILDSFFRSLNTDIDIDKYTFTKENITPPDAAMMFFYQLSFLPFVRWEWNTLRNEIFQMDFSSWKSYRCTLLPSFVFSLDDAAKRALLRQGELLHDTNWYDYTLARGKKLAAIENHDLPLEIQHGIWEKLSETARNIICRHWPRAKQIAPQVPFLPSLEKFSPDIFEQMTILRRGYTVCLGNLLTSHAKVDSLVKEKEKQRKLLATRLSSYSKSFSFGIRVCFSLLFSSLARQAYAIHQSGLFDVRWYLEKYPDVATSGIDPVLHYVRYCTKEGLDPAPWFSTNAYLQAYPDVEASGVNPFYHYIRYGYAEGRKSFEC